MKCRTSKEDNGLRVNKDLRLGDSYYLPGGKVFTLTLTLSLRERGPFAPLMQA